MAAAGASSITTDVVAAAKRLREGGLVAFPTETVYGLGADATNDKAVAAIYAAKERPVFNPLIVHVADLAQAETCVQFTETARKLAAKFWPGPLTMVLPRRPECPISLLVSAGLPTVGVRVPDHPVALALLRASGCFVAAPSANRSGKISPTTAAHVVQSLGVDKALVLDGGSCAIGVESTIIDLSTPQPMLLRPGGVTVEDLERELGPVQRPNPAAHVEPGQSFTSPGQMLSHYAPNLPVRLNATAVHAGEILLSLGSAAAAPQGALLTLSLSDTGDLQEAAANLFKAMHEADARGQELGAVGIAIMPISNSGLGLAINDRLNRAAATRPSEEKP